MFHQSTHVSSVSHQIFHREKITRAIHSGIILLTIYLVVTSPWLFMARKLMPNTNWLNLFHVYLGLLTCALSIVFLVIHCINGYWRQFFPWIIGDIKPLIKDLFGIFKGITPPTGGHGLFSCIEGLGLLSLTATGITGSLWFITQGSADAMFWRNIHSHFAMGFIVYLCIHIICAFCHFIDFLRNLK